MKKVLRHFLDIRFVLCFGASWIICHGWSFAAVIFGGLFKINWLTILGSTWVAILMMPNGFGIIIPLPLAIFFQESLFPKSSGLKEDLKEMFENKKKEREIRKILRLERKQNKLKDKE